MPYQRGQYQDKWRLERMAASVRQRLGLTQTDILDPWAFADAVPAHVFYTEDLVPPALAANAAAVNWDGLAFAVRGHLMIVLNSARPSTRQCATLLEEISHHLLGHQPSALHRDAASGLLRREYNPAQEAEAYDFGTILLLPKELIQEYVKVTRGRAEDLAQRCGCSVEVVHMRIKRCRLWGRYLTN